MVKAGGAADIISRYSMSFTAGSLFHRESVEFAALYLDFGGWRRNHR